MTKDSKKQIIIKGAKEHNLQNIDLAIPRDEFIVITGLSGSGKSSLAFDTIYAEGQRRYVESLSAYARQFLGQMKKPEMEYIEGLSPAISIDQKTTKENPRSTVGTITEIYDYLRLLFARIGTPHCPKCGKEISHQTLGQIGDSIIEEGEGKKIHILAPVVRDKKGQHKDVLDDLRNKGFVRAREDGEVRDLEEDIDLPKTYRHSIEVVVDRLKIRKDVDFKRRLVDSLETASEFAAMKDPYVFDFIPFKEDMMERDIEQALVKDVTKLLLELGTGFAFLGNQYHLNVGGDDFYIDLLFYNLNLRCYVVIELKTGEFKPEYAGQLNFYLSAVDGILKKDDDHPSIGLLLCKSKNDLVAEYALKDMSKPMGISAYKVTSSLPEELQRQLPSIEDIEKRIQRE